MARRINSTGNVLVETADPIIEPEIAFALEAEELEVPRMGEIDVVLPTGRVGRLSEIAEVNETARILMAQPKRNVFIPPGLDGKPIVDQVNINGVKCVILTGVTQAVPQSVYEILLQSNYTTPRREDDLRHMSRVDPRVAAYIATAQTMVP